MVVDFTKTVVETEDDDLEILFLKLKVLELKLEEILMTELLKKVST